MAARTFLLLPVDVVAQGFIQYSLELAPLAFCNLAQCRQHIGSGLGGKFFTDDSGHVHLHHDLS